MFTPADWAILVVIGVSALLSLVRGFVREAISLCAWTGAFVVTGKFYSVLAQRLTYFDCLNDNAIARTALSVFILFTLTLLVIGTCGNILRALIDKAGLSGTDRLLGVAFGAMRGVLVVCALLAVMQIGFKLGILGFVLDKPMYADSVLIPELQRIVNWFFLYLSSPLTSTTGA